jgi:hypothetical protein
MKAPALVDPALELCRELGDGALFTPWAEARSGQVITAKVERENPPHLWGHEAADLGMDPAESWAVVRRGGYLVQADGVVVARITSTVSVGRAHQVDEDLIERLNTTDTPLGMLLGEHGHSQVLSCDVAITEYAVTCSRLIFWDDVALALTTERVPWAWLGPLPLPAKKPCVAAHGFSGPSSRVRS